MSDVAGYLIAQGAQDVGCDDSPRTSCLTLAGPGNCESRRDNRLGLYYGIVKDNWRSLGGLNQLQQLFPVFFVFGVDAEYVKKQGRVEVHRETFQRVECTS